MEMSAEKTKLMTKVPMASKGRSRLKEKLGTVTSFKYLGTVTSFKYLGAFVVDEGSKPEILKDGTSHCSSDKAETSIEITYLLVQRTGVLPWHIHNSVGL